ncbi:5-histidylcysteine sulfoxide synthase [Coleofasciculus chthonoplastes]|uniref:5-histidylcysteine sulfoxide synthase n=1 Tax=Coleofasciculus chthonoplastes TaxID=64178 RepID=UPI0032F0AFAF
MDWLKSTQPPRLDKCDRETLFDYFENSWELEEILMKSLIWDETFYVNPDALRNPLIFYLGHSPVFYINKLVRVGLLDKRINPDYEILFEMGVDPTTPAELNQAMADVPWPQVDEVWQYREKAKAEVAALIHNTPLNLPINQNHPLWALIMGMEHNRIHFETSSMLIRQLPVDRLERPDSWQYARSDGKIPANKMIQIAGGVAQLGKPKDAPTYGWDSEYGSKTVEVKPFLASQYLITNGEFLKFVQENGYDNREFWDEESWSWKSDYNIKHPKFWIPSHGSYKYRAMFDQIDLPLDWPVEVNHNEAMAYCRWQGKGVRLISEAEWQVAAAHCEDEQEFNLHVKYGSPTPVGCVETAKSPSGLYDIRGNVWEWLSDEFKPLPGFKPHFLYEDYSAPFFDTQHQVMRGGAWASTGTYASASCRNWFRRNFYQHAGFRIAQDLEEEK